MFGKKLNLFTVFLVALLLLPLGFSIAALQVSSHTTIPSVLYPGVAGQLQLSISNSGADTATGVSIFYTDPSSGYQTYVAGGDIGSGSNTIVSIPFTVPQNVSAGYVTMYLNLYYSDSTNSNIHSVPLTIPLQVSQHQVLEVKTVSVSPSVINPGDHLTATLNISNTGGSMHNVAITLSNSNGFSLDGTSTISVGEISAGSSKQVDVPISSSSSTSSGKYSIPLDISYQDNLQNSINQTAYVSSISVSDSSGIMVSAVALDPTEVGSNVRFNITISNNGGSASSATLDINQTSIFTPLGTSHIVFDSIDAHSSSSQIVQIGISPSVSSGYYSIPFSITTNGRQSAQNIGVDVSATPDVRVSIDMNPQTPTAGSSVSATIQLSNVGNSPIRSLYSGVLLSRGSNMSVVGPSDKFIGTLNIDDFATYSVTLDLSPNLAPGRYSIPVTISFKDGKNQDHSLTKNVDIMVYSNSDFSRLNSGQSPSQGASGFGSRRNTNSNAGGLFGLGLIPTIAIAIIVLIALYFGYKKFGPKKKPVEKVEK